MDGSQDPILVRPAHPADVNALTELRPPRGLHVDRFDDDKQYVLAEVDGKPAGFGVIQFRGDPMWERPEHVPLVMDVWVAPNLRRRGIGSRVIAALEASARERGFPCVYIQVQADKNPRAVDLYKRLGYQTLQAKPYPDPYRHVDEQGNVRAGVEVIVDMQKWL
jgi:ribosomal protein S18 acetylase RimI-like enzyme